MTIAILYDLLYTKPYSKLAAPLCTFFDQVAVIIRTTPVKRKEY